ncbi:MAG: hypothetical protein K0U98_11845 [Deltaproteobacteria bacterium]|nr:hypothetical protein [Deltaproteobacteria bacterium]
MKNTDRSPFAAVASAIKKLRFVFALGAILILALSLGGRVVETVQNGTYQIKQAAVTGHMSAKMEPGLWFQNFGDIKTWNKAETFYFTADAGEGEKFDQSIEVRFNDGSLCNISGTMRIILPTSDREAISLMTDYSYRDYTELERKLVLPVVRNALRLTSNLMSARESYSEQRTDFIFWAWDQIQNGLYETTEETRRVLDPVSGEEVTKTFKIIEEDATGSPIHQRNPLEGLGIKLANFEIKEFVYTEKVQAQIATQQEALMAVATARAQAQQAEQDALTREAKGKAQVMLAKYQEEESKIRAVVKAEQALEVSRLEKDAAEMQKEKEILLGQGEAERKRLVLAADGALAQKLAAMMRINEQWANAYAQRQVPSLVMGGGEVGGSDKATTDFAQMMQLLVAGQMGLDLNIPSESGR